MEQKGQRIGEQVLWRERIAYCGGDQPFQVLTRRLLCHFLALLLNKDIVSLLLLHKYLGRKQALGGALSMLGVRKTGRELRSNFIPKR